MTDETKQLLEFQLEVIHRTMKDNGVALALIIDKEDVDESIICFIDKEQYFSKRKMSGISVSLTDFNKELI